MFYLKNLCLTLITLFLISRAQAFEPLNTDDAGTVKKGGNQIEMYFYSIHKLNQPAGPGQDVSSPGAEFVGPGSTKSFPFTYTRGVSENVEIAIGTQYNATPRASNYSPLSNYNLNAKWRFWGEEGDSWNFAIKPILQFPDSKQQQVVGLGQAAFNYGATFISSYYLNESLETHINVGYMRSPYNVNYLNGGSASPLRLNIYSASIAPVWNVMDGLRLALDFGVQTNPPSTEQQSTMYGMVAAIIGLSESVDFGISMMRSAQNTGLILVGNGPNSTRLDTGITWRFD
jgi:hypothetical protein